MNEYNETVEWLYTQIPQFERQGANGYKPGLQTAERLDKAFGNPHKHYATIHVGGTNGKGSTSHTIAAILQAAGYRTGLYTSPHLIDFRERIRVNGQMIDRYTVVDFVHRYRAMNLDCAPSFFELTMTMAFEHFAREKVDVAVIEVGLGGRLDSTNIIMPVLSVITNISLDHTAFLGKTEELIATEKAGIIKHGIPVVIGEAKGDVLSVFKTQAERMNAPLLEAQRSTPYTDCVQTDEFITYHDTPFGDIRSCLTGDCQPANTATIITAVKELIRQGFIITPADVKRGFEETIKMTGLMGRWMQVSENPRVICDTGHNIGGWQYLGARLQKIAKSETGKLHVILGFVNDKDFGHIIDCLPDNCRIYYTQASTPRAVDVTKLSSTGSDHGRPGESYKTVAEAYLSALTYARPEDTIFVGGSTYVVADFLTDLKHDKNIC